MLDEAVQPEKAGQLSRVSKPGETEELKEVDQSTDELIPEVDADAENLEQPARKATPPKLPLFKGTSGFAMRFTKALGIVGGYSRKRPGSSGFDFDTRRDSATETDMRYDFPKF